MNNKKRCGVIGNPISHSKSPEIHSDFAAGLPLEIQYDKFLLTDETLAEFVHHFFENGGTGLNVTLPFKQSVISLVDELSENAFLCQSVNTLYVNQQNKICGETTDGDGLLLDLNKLSFDYHNKNILVIGAGGASVSIICSLLKQNANIRIINRSMEKVDKLVDQFSTIGNIKPFDPNEKIYFDGVICAISQANASIYKKVIPRLKPDAFIYDLNYKERAEETLACFKQAGFSRLSDGYGMLVGQAAKSFEIWHGVLPGIRSYIN